MKNFFGSNLKLISFIFSAVISAAIVLLLILDVALPLINELELKSRDIRFRIRETEEPSKDIVVVAIDDKSLLSIGRWPWPRLLLARMIELLSEGGARAVGVDLLLTEPEESREAQRIRKLIESYLQHGMLSGQANSQAFFDQLVTAAESADNDRFLAKMTGESGRVVHSTVFLSYPVPNEDALRFLKKARIGKVESSRRSNQKEKVVSGNRYKGVLLPIPVLGETAAQIGFVNVSADSDGALRKGIAVIKYQGNYYTSLPVKTYQVFAGIGKNGLVYNPGNNHFRVGDYSIPMDKNGEIYINYLGPPYTIPFFSFVDVLTDKVPPETFRDKCVMIGGAATGLGDHWANPYSGNFWGVEAQATLMENLHTRHFLRRPMWIVLTEAIMAGILGLFLGYSITRTTLKKAIPLFAGILVIYPVLVHLAFVKYHIVMSFAAPVLMFLLIGGVGLAIRYLEEGKEKKVLKNAFQQYMHPSVISRILKHPENLALGGEKKELTVLFSDIRNFTSISEMVSPESLVHLMNRYLTIMTDVILDNKGILDKYIGDALMAIYGAPEEMENHSVKACDAAIRMMELLHDIRKDWINEGLPKIGAGVGVNTGEMIVGNMGSNRRFDYTVIGDAVNLASRLEGLTKVYGVKILVGESTREQVGSRHVFREMDLVRVKGKRKPVKIFELIGKDYFTGGQYSYVDTFENGLAAYREKKWEKAIEWFEKTLEIKLEDCPSRFYISRCQEMKNMSLPDNWDFVFVLDKK